ncbi:MAG: oxidoreductase [Verrucomicrobiae bacterium]|nr:oxidoreductase [Verrucomicrobiae bacterium]
MARLKLATVWLGGCSGCHMSFLDMDEWLVELQQRADVVYGPFVDTKEYPQDVDLVLIEGAVCNSDHVELLHTLRSRTKVVVAFGDCAVTGNVPAMRNALGGAAPVLQRAYIELADTNPQIPRAEGVVPPLLERVVPVHAVIPVEHFLPGCPPDAGKIKAFLTMLLEGQPVQLSPQEIKFG